jgi:hypothetical protein
MMENIYNFKIKKRIHFLKKNIICFVSVETDLVPYFSYTSAMEFENFNF